MLGRLQTLILFVLTGPFLYGQNISKNTSQQFFSSNQIDSLFDKIDPQKWSTAIERKAKKLEDNIVRKSEKILRKLQKQEEKLKRKLDKIDSVASHNFFTDAQTRYTQLLQKVHQKSNAYTGGLTGEYLPYLDSLKGSLSFLGQKGPEGSLKDLAPENVTNALTQINQAESKLKQADDIKQFIQQRKEQIKKLVKQFKLPGNLSRNLKNINKEVYYYSAQIHEYKEMFRDPDNIERKALSLLNKLPAFQKFMKENSQLSGLFGGMAGTSVNTSNSTGLQSRAQVISFMQNQFGANGPNVQSLVQRNIQSAQGQINQIRSKLESLGSSSGDLDMPNFKPNNQKTKTFLQRLEYGTNLQTAHSSSYFPITTDIGMSVGYRINDKNILGIGASYKVGWGTGINHINITSQGAGFRSFIDFNIKKSFFASGGFEYNYQQPFNSVSILNNLNNWQQSGLIGISKIVSMNTKVFKKTKIQVLWDFLSYRQKPQTAEFKFRIGYSF